MHTKWSIEFTSEFFVPRLCVPGSVWFAKFSWKNHSKRWSFFDCFLLLILQCEYSLLMHDVVLWLTLQSIVLYSAHVTFSPHRPMFLILILFVTLCEFYRFHKHHQWFKTIFESLCFDCLPFLFPSLINIPKHWTHSHINCLLWFRNIIFE